MTLILLLATCIRMDAASISNAVAEELSHEIRPGGVSQSAFWNANAMRFMYPPSIEFLPVKDATAYEMTVVDAIGRKFSWKSNDPVARLSPHWTDLATGYANLLVEALGAKGEHLGKTQGRFFWKKAAFTGNYPPAARTYRESADRLYGYILDSAPLKYLAEHGAPDPDYPLNCYPTKIHSAVIGAMLNLAKRFPARADYAMKIARLSADRLLAGAAPADAPLAGFTPTYEGKNLAAKDYAGQSMNLYPANAVTAFLGMFETTGEPKYREAAVRIGETYLRLQGNDGTWCLKQNFADGEPVCPNRAFPLGIARALVSLAEKTGRDDFRAAADRAFAYIDNGPLKDWDWEGQFEDVLPMPKYSNLTKHSACDTALFCLKRFPGDKRRLAEARDVLRFAEDQFVEWERPFVGIGGRPLQWGVNAKLTWMMDETHIRKAVYPSVLEQYRCYVPISSSSSKLIRTYLALYRAEGKALDLEKARALGDAMTRAQRPDGSIPTTMDPAAPYSGDWLNCLIADAAALNELAETVETGDSVVRPERAPRKALKVLMLGNSFSLSVGKEMPKVAQAMGLKLDLASLKDGASALGRHWHNWIASTNADLRPCRYDRWTDGTNVVDNQMVNMAEAIALEKWDVVTFQQASYTSWQPASYQPSAERLQVALRSVQPQAEFVWQETWSYSPFAAGLAKWNIDADEMYARIHQAYAAAAKTQRIIPMGTAIQRWRRELPVETKPDSQGGDLVGRVTFVRKKDGSLAYSGDTIHLNKAGEYFQALVWTAKLFCVDVRTCPYMPEGVTPEHAELMKRLAMEM